MPHLRMFPIIRYAILFRTLSVSDISFAHLPICTLTDLAPSNTNQYESNHSFARKDVEGVKLPGTLGRFEVLKGHAPIISTLVAGTVECIGNEPYQITVSGGFVEVANNAISVCVEM